MLIHTAILSVPFPYMIPRMTGPIEVFILEGPGVSASSGETENKNISREKPHQEVRKPIVRKESFAKPEEPVKPVEKKTEPIQATADTIPVQKSAPVQESTASGKSTETTTTVASGHTANSSSGSGGAGSTMGSGAGEATVGFGTPSGPRFLHRAIPEYPFLARRRKMEGKVILAVIIDETGKLTKTEVIEASDRTFVDASLEALKKSTFLPARRNGQPVTCKAILPIRFSLVD